MIFKISVLMREKTTDACEYVLKTTKEMSKRFIWMLKVRDCRHICLFCEYYETCRNEETTKTIERKEDKNESIKFI